MNESDKYASPPARNHLGSSGCSMCVCVYVCVCVCVCVCMCVDIPVSRECQGSICVSLVLFCPFSLPIPSRHGPGRVYRERETQRCRPGCSTGCVFVCVCVFIVNFMNNGPLPRHQSATSTQTLDTHTHTYI
jgi:hypothetical protein